MTWEFPISLIHTLGVLEMLVLVVLIGEDLTTMFTLVSGASWLWSSGAWERAKVDPRSGDYEEQLIRVSFRNKINFVYSKY